jgi:hypothetical protein
LDPKSDETRLGLACTRRFCPTYLSSPVVSREAGPAPGLVPTRCETRGKGDGGPGRHPAGVWGRASSESRCYFWLQPTSGQRASWPQRKRASGLCVRLHQIPWVRVVQGAKMYAMPCLLELGFEEGNFVSFKPVLVN